ncbi:MAG: sugar phosphate nucleotidyltransferase, partial [Candidatus Thermoplasmatota archaeon]|nr:sugar phosphate nucleotidyltransferase [Candidatus Thermoplasmatota archaeon]
MKAVILAGGSGERFWPISTIRTPKQFLKLFDGKTLLRQTYERIGERFDDSDILVITSRDHAALTKADLPELPQENIIGEPCRRNTAPACMMGALLSEKDEVNLVLPADHRIPDHEGFWRSFDLALRGSREHGGLYTFGISPTRPETGYGYIGSEREIDPGLFSVSNFREKPDRTTAEEYIRSGDFFWNSGMFLWKAGDLIDEMGKCSPDIYTPMVNLDPENMAQLDEVYRDLPARSIDNAVMELSGNVKMVKGEFTWSDVGSWDSIRELEEMSDEGDGLAMVRSSNIFLRSTIGRPVGVVGLENIMIIDAPEGLLICSNGSAQDVREVARKL